MHWLLWLHDTLSCVLMIIKVLPQQISTCLWFSTFSLVTVGLDLLSINYKVITIAIMQIIKCNDYIIAILSIGGSEGGPRGAVPPLAFLLPPLGSQLIPETGIMYSYCIQKYRKQMGK